MTTPNNTSVKLDFVKQTCSSINYLSVLVQVNESSKYIGSRTGCENLHSPLLYEYLGLGNWVMFGVMIQYPLSSYVVQLNVTVEARLWKTQLHVTSDMGKNYLLSACVSVSLFACLNRMGE